MHWRNAKSKMAPTIAVTALVAVTLAALLCQHAVQGGIIVKRQALSAEEELTTVAPPATTVATIEEREETSTEAAPTTRTISFERDVEGLTKEIEFGYDSENREASGEQASVAELTRVDPTAVTTEVPIEEEEEVATTVPPVIASAELVDNSVTARSNANDISAELEATTTVATTDDVPTTVVPAASGEEVVEAQSDVGSGVVEFQTEGRHAVIDVEQFKSVEEASLPRFELERYTSASNFSQGGISLEDSRAERDQFFATTPSSLLPEPTTTTTESLEPSDSVTQLVFTENNEVLVPEGTNHTIERNSTVRVEQREVESTDYEVVSNEVRNQTLVKGGKKGKFLDQFGATEDNDINGAVWALAGMRMVDRASSKVGEATEGSVEVVRDENENVVANNTLKQLMDWAAIMQAADFANTSFVRPTSGEVVDLKSELKDRRKYGNRTPGELDAASEENRITSVVTEVVPEASVEVTTVVAPKVEVSSTTEAAGDDDLEDFKFEDRSKVMTTKRPELTNFIQETTTVFNVRTEEAMTTMRPTRNYEVSENVDETEKFALPGRTTTTGRSEISTTFEDIPVTTYSPASPVAKRTDATTESLIPTTFESMRAVITRRPAVTTTQEPRSAEETTLLMTTMITTTTTTVAPTTTNGANEPVVNDQDNGSSEIDVNSVNQTNNEIVMITTTTTESADSIIPQQSTVLPTVVEFRPSQETTDTSSPSEQSEEQPTVPNQPVQVDDKSVYDTVSETTLSPVPEPEPSAAPEPEPTASEPAVTSTRRSIERQMTTEVLSEEESVTEEDYVELNASTVANANSSKSPLDQNATEPTAEQEEEGSGVVVAVVTSLVVVIVVLLLIAAYLIFRKRQAQVSYGQRCRPVGLDAYSLDNVSVYNSVRRGKGNTMRMSKRSYGNSAFEDPGLKTNPLTVAELANIIQNKTAIYDEFKEIPNVTARADEVPEGCEDKNRYANVVPLPETRVHLKRINDDEKTEYINANFVKGPKDSSNYYIACQAPMENTINDFWRMIWEQNSKVIIMATDLSENGVEKCAEYLPPSVVLDNNRTFGDFQLTLKNRENKEKYTISTVHLRNTQTNTWREIMHFWYQWPDTGVPIDESSIIAMLLEARSYSRLAPAEMAETTTPAATNTNTTSNGGRDTLGMGMAMGMNGITSIAEEDSTSQLDSSLVSSLNVDSSNNNVVGGKTASEPPSSIMTNGTNTMDKHKSLQRTQGPITMHCSPGTGRTGTIIACDVALRAVEIPPRNVDVPHIVYYVRRGRASAVRTREQYELIYRVANVYATKLTGPTIET
uniref:Tyrosine-protein phosphatase non-receptor type 9 n=1 Tax=Culex pipiens TaxID=7175 RepID=A0A8D8FF87_CULPI